MRHAFTLIEVMIVMAIIAIVASIAVPNLLEARVTAQEAAAASSLKSGILSAQIGFQSGDYADADSNGIGTYAVDGIISPTTNPYNCMTGASLVGPKLNITLNLLPTNFTVTTPYSSALGTATTLPASPVWPQVAGYYFKTAVTTTAPNATPNSDGTGESSWGVLAFPIDNDEGRKFFVINQSGEIYMSRPSSQACSGATTGLGGCVSSVLNAAAFGPNLITAPSNTYLPYR